MCQKLEMFLNLLAKANVPQDYSKIVLPRNLVRAIPYVIHMLIKISSNITSDDFCEGVNQVKLEIKYGPPQGKEFSQSAFQIFTY